MTWDEMACYLLVGALVFLLAYGAGQVTMIWLAGVR